MGIENPKKKREDINQVTKSEYENAVRYGEIQEKATETNEGLDQAKSWTTKAGVLKHLKEDPDFPYERISPEFWKDKEVVLEGVKNSGFALSLASPELQNDKEIVLAAVEHEGTALEYASPEMRADKEIVMKALQCYENPRRAASNAGLRDRVLKFASPEVRKELTSWKSFFRRL